MSTRTPVTLPEPGYTHLFGWPVAVLDELVALAKLAYADHITLAEWRVSDAQLRVASGLPAVPPAAFGPLYAAAARTYLEQPADPTRDEHMERLLDRIRALVPPPDDTTVRRRLDSFARQLDTLADQPTEAHSERDDLVTRLARLRRWVDGDAVRDPGCGLRADAVARYREIPDDTFGTVPLSPAETRARAWAAADDTARAEARQYLGHDAARLLDADTLTTRAAAAERDRQVLLRLVTTAGQQRGRADACGDAARTVWQLWTHGGLRPLFDETLDAR